MDEELSIEKQFQLSSVNTSFSLSEFVQPLRNLRIKYLTLNTMDHFDKM